MTKTMSEAAATRFSPTRGQSSTRTAVDALTSTALAARSGPLTSAQAVAAAGAVPLEDIEDTVFCHVEDIEDTSMATRASLPMISPPNRSHQTSRLLTSMSRLGSPAYSFAAPEDIEDTDDMENTGRVAMGVPPGYQMEVPSSLEQPRHAQPLEVTSSHCSPPGDSAPCDDFEDTSRLWTTATPTCPPTHETHTHAHEHTHTHNTCTPVSSPRSLVHPQYRHPQPTRYDLTGRGITCDRLTKCSARWVRFRV